MRITANQIEQWGKTRAAQEELPLLLRKLIAATNQLTELTMPGGDSIYRPGWDGMVNASSASAWVPQGRSVWELGCDTAITAKANNEYNKRSIEFDAKYKSANAFIFVSPRRWHQKAQWLTNKQSLNEWREIKVIDADDIETWLENTPCVAIEFAQQLGLSGFGVNAIAQYWQNWSEQSEPNISVQAIITQREAAKSELLTQLENNSQLIVIEADSKEEAVAFCCAALIEHPLKTATICITNEQGWQFCENPNISVVINAVFNSANTPSPKQGLTLIQPICHGDLQQQNNTGSHIVIPRVKPLEFEQALVNLGEEPSDASRLVTAAGRSWSVYRRLKAQNPAIRQPYWQDKIEYDCLAVLMLVGAWNTAKQGDIAFIEALTNQAYEAIETKLCELLPLDDSPVIKIGDTWKAKSPLELLYILAPKLSTTLLKRFLALTQSMLAKPDPQLDLPDDKRYAAAIYGKVRAESGIIIKSVNHSLGKLKTFAETSNITIANEINYGIDNLVRALLYEVNENAWMSLASYLPAIAEAAPDTFLACLEKSLAMPEQPVAGLIKNTTDAGFSGRCWYSGLLWGLEIIAWNPSKLARITKILIALDEVPSHSKWSNSPYSTLDSLYRVQVAQTLATPEQKITILGQLIKQNESFAWRFLNNLIPRGRTTFFHNSKPNWRDDDAGSTAEKSVYYPHYLVWIGESVLTLAHNNPERIATLLDKYSSFTGEYKDRLIELVEQLPMFDDLGKEVILEKLRKRISLRKNDEDDKHSTIALNRLKQAYFDNQPDNLLIRYRWLFERYRIDLPEGERKNYEQVEQLSDTYRINAIKHLYELDGFTAIEQFKNEVKEHRLLGLYLAKIELGDNIDELISFAIAIFIKDDSNANQQLLSGLLNYIACEDLDDLIVSLQQRFIDLHLSTEQKYTIVECLPYKVKVFELIESLGIAVDEHYWSTASFDYIKADTKEFHFVLQKLIERNRNRCAFNLIHYEFNAVDARTVYNILTNIQRIEEDAPLPDSYDIGEAIEYIESKGVCTQRELALLEFGYLPAFRYSEKLPNNLKRELLSNPKMFIELICFAYKPNNDEENSEDITPSEHIIDLSWQVLHDGRGVPGLQQDGTINVDQFNQWIEQTRLLGAQHHRATITDQIIGQWLSACPEEQTGVWPCYPVCELLEKIDAEQIRNCFAIGVRNNRGVTTRAYGEGGGQERALAAKYKGYADNIRDLYPMTAMMLDDIAKGYEYDAKREDDTAQIGFEMR